MTLDGWALFCTIGSHRDAFTECKPEVHKAALTIVTKALKKAKSLDQLRTLYNALGEEQFSVVLEHMADKDTAGLVKIFDVHNPARAAASTNWVRSHVFALASGKCLPAEKPAKPIKAARVPSKKSSAGPTENIAWPSSMTTVAPRRKD